MGDFPKSPSELLADFNKADSELSNGLRCIEASASIKLADTEKDEEVAKTTIAAYRLYIRDNVTLSEPRNKDVLTVFGQHYDKLKSVVTEIERDREILRKLRNEQNTLRHDLVAALEGEMLEKERAERAHKEAAEAARQEQARIEKAREEALKAAQELERLERERIEEARKKALEAQLRAHRRRLRRYLTVSGVAACLAIGLHMWLLSRTVLTFEILIDGKPASSDELSGVHLDGKAFFSGNRIGLGHHVLEIDTEGIEPFRREFSIFYGGKNLGLLNIVRSKGQLFISSDPTNATFYLFGHGLRRKGNLPLRISDIPVGSYQLIVTRNGWDIGQTINVRRDLIATNQTVFPYGSIEARSDPPGVAFSTNGVYAGKTPVTLHEIAPGNYKLAVTDGENDLTATVTLRPKEALERTFTFRYGAVEILTAPSGATVVHNGKEVGHTPLTLNHVPVGESTVGLRLDDYAPTNFAIATAEGATTSASVKLVSLRYLQAMEDAQQAINDGEYSNALQFASAALAADPGNEMANDLFKDISLKIHHQNADKFLADNRFDEAQKECDEADSVSPEATETSDLRGRIVMRKQDRFNELILESEDSLSHNDIDEASAKLTQAAKLFPDSFEVANLHQKIGPALQNKIWTDFVQEFSDSLFSETVTLKYNKSLADARTETIDAVRRALCVWKLKKESRPENSTVCLALAPAGLLAKVAFPRAGALMISQIGNNLVEIRIKTWVYPPVGADPEIARKNLKVDSENLFINLKGPLGEPLTE